MTEAEVIEQYVAQLDGIGIDRPRDKEMAHGDADQALLSALGALGAGAIAAAWIRCEERHNGWWYA